LMLGTENRLMMNTAMLAIIKTRESSR
jgi:hypothetical protein